ncbi:MAG: PHP domain-containing protein [Nitrososphaerota archaeon]
MKVSHMMIAPDDSIDLQLHTVYSDGQWQPEALFAHLARERFRVVSITDHDTMEHLNELRALGRAHGVHVVPGVEMTTSWRGKSAHLLCYAAEFRGDALARMGHDTVAAQLANTRAVYAELIRSGHRFASERAMPVRPIDNARLLLAHGYATTMDNALRMIAEAGYRSITFPLADAVTAAHASGALAILAHPGRGGGEIQQYDPPLLTEVLAEVPLDGIEVCYPTYREEQVSAYTAFAREHSLLMSAGSDSHGPQQRLPIPYPAVLCAELLRRCGVTMQ